MTALLNGSPGVTHALAANPSSPTMIPEHFTAHPLWARHNAGAL
jgi:hypothetical protein